MAICASALFSTLVDTETNAERGHLVMYIHEGHKHSQHQRTLPSHCNNLLACRHCANRRTAVISLYQMHFSQRIKNEVTCMNAGLPNFIFKIVGKSTLDSENAGG